MDATRRLLLAAAVAAIAPWAAAQDYPTRPVRIIVGFPAGVRLTSPPV